MGIINVMAAWRYITPVVDAQDKLLGVVTRARLLTALAESGRETASSPDAEPGSAAA